MATSAANGKTEKNGVVGVILGKIDLGVMNAAAEEYGPVPNYEIAGVAKPTTMQLREASLALFQHMCNGMDEANKKRAKNEDEPEIELVVCDVCEGEAPESCERCPYCGAGGTVEAADDPSPEIAPRSATVQDDAPAGAKPKTGKKKDKGAKASSSALAVVPAKEIEMTTAAAATADTKVKKTGADIVPIHGKAVTAKTLDKYVREAQELYSNSKANYMAFGRKLAEIHDKGLFKLRLDESGKAKYASWDAFVHHEIGITPKHSYQCMDHGRAFTDEDAAALGVKKMTLILQAPPEARESLKEDVKKNKTTKRKLAAQVKEVREKAGYVGSKHAQVGAKGGKAKAAKAAAKAHPTKVTVAAIEGKKTIKVFQKPATLRNLDLSALKRAKTISETSTGFGVIELTNEVSLYLTIAKDKNGELQLTYEARRPSAEE